MNSTIIGFLVLVSTVMTPVTSVASPQSKVLANHEMSLKDRLPGGGYGNEVFADNILLALHYFKGDADSFKINKNLTGPENIDWNKVRKPFGFTVELRPNEVFAFHKNLLKEFKGADIKNTGSTYSYQDGYKELAGLYGNGVCHLASLINWVASHTEEKDKKLLAVTAKVNHDFSPVPDVPREYGTAIYYMPGNDLTSEDQNLYIKNTSSKTVKFVFNVNKDKVDVKAEI